MIKKAATFLLQEHFPKSYHEAILNEINFQAESLLDTTTQARRKRDPKFRDKLLVEYRRQCAICQSNIRLDDALFDLQAAHIMWHAHGGPDTTDNGLALCLFHHHAFDLGAIGLDQKGDGYQVKISPTVNGSGPARNWLLDYEGKRLNNPIHEDSIPNQDYVHWHDNEVFKS